MVFAEILGSVTNLTSGIFSNFIPIPETLAQPFIINEYGAIAFLVLFFITLAFARFLSYKNWAILFAILAATSFVFGGFYLTLLTIIVQVPLVFILKIGKGEGIGGLGKGMDDFGKEGKGLFGKKKKKEDEFGDLGDLGKGMDETSEFKDVETTTPPMQPISVQKVCPYCNTPLRYVSQYQRYYCDKCQRYV